MTRALWGPCHPCLGESETPQQQRQLEILDSQTAVECNAEYGVQSHRQVVCQGVLVACCPGKASQDPR